MTNLRILTRWLGSTLLATLLIAANVGAQEESGQVALSALPSAVVTAMKQARPQAQPRSANVMWPRDDGVYVVQAVESGREVRFVVTGNGNVLNVIDVDR